MDFVQTVLQPIVDNWQIFAAGILIAIGAIKLPSMTKK